jgi:hypothetical protein
VRQEQEADVESSSVLMTEYYLFLKYCRKLVFAVVDKLPVKHY